VAALTTLGIIAATAMAAGQATLAAKAAKARANQNNPADASQILGSGGRVRPDGAPVTGTAVTREAYAEQVAKANAPPNTAELASANTVSAYAAGERARKRAAAGGSVLTKTQMGLPSPTGNYAPKTLLGS
jgi:hypothetical protein